LQARNGGTGDTINRIGGGAIHLEHCRMPMAGGIQPGRLRSCLVDALEDGPSNGGLVQRFQVLAWPDTGFGWRYVDRRANAEPHQPTGQAFGSLIELDAEATRQVGDGILAAYHRAQTGIRARLRGEEPVKPEDLSLLRDVTTLLIDTGMRPDKCYRLRCEHIRDGAVHVPCGNTSGARRALPLTQRSAALLDLRRERAVCVCIFPALTRSERMEKSTLKKQHPRACALVKVPPFTMYDLRHTCLTRWAAHMDPYTLACLAGHSGFSTTRRYVHPQTETVRAALKRLRAQVETPAKKSRRAAHLRRARLGIRVAVAICHAI
jgi:hypothetical protein